MTEKEAVDRLLRGAQEVMPLAGKVLESVKEIKGSSPEEAYFHALVQCSVARTREFLSAQLLLCREGHCNSALVLSRTIFEIALNIAYIAKDPIVRAGLFGQYEIIRKKRYTEALRRTAYKTALEGRDEEIKQTEELHARFQSNFPDKSRWSGISLRDIARDLGIEGEYDTCYSYQCDASHSNARELTKYIKPQGAGLLFDAGPSWAELQPALGLGVLYTLYTLSVHEDVFKGGFQKEIDAIVAKLQA